MKPLKVRLSERTLKKIKDIVEQTEYTNDQIVEMALVMGISQLKKWLEEDE